MQLRLPGLVPPAARPSRPSRPSPGREVRVAGESVALAVVRHRRARRYVLRVASDGSLRLTVPRGASVAGGLRFAERQADWIVRERLRQARRRAPWTSGSRIWFRGETVELAVAKSAIKFAGLVLSYDGDSPVREVVERYLRERAERDLASRTRALASEHRRAVTAIQIRNQRSRWGACSGRGVITLNWRLMQMPPSVSDYIICHELAHLKHANHGARFWREVERLCPEWRDAERWIRRFGREIL